MDRGLHFFRGQFSVMTEMRHDGDVTTAHFLDVSEQLNETESASGSVVKRYARTSTRRVPIRKFLMCGRWSGSLKGSRYCLSLRWVIVTTQSALRRAPTRSERASKSEINHPRHRETDDESHRWREGAATPQNAAASHMFVFMIMGSPPVNRMSETSSCVLQIIDDARTSQIESASSRFARPSARNPRPR